MTLLKHLILCADDFGQNIPISEGILQLAGQERINAISCLVNMPVWYEFINDLLKLPESCHVGLHLNLTFGQALSAIWRKKLGDNFIGLPDLLSKTYLKRLDPVVLLSEIKAQLYAFIETTGRYPDFIDGHQHIHQLPQIRDALLLLYQQEKLACYIRHTYNSWHDFIPLNSAMKVQALAILGGRCFAKQLKKHEISTNTSFSGIYAFNKSYKYRDYFQSFMALSKSGGLIMCHPGHKSQDTSDPLYKYREYEYNYLMSDNFLLDMAKHSSKLTKNTC